MDQKAVAAGRIGHDWLTRAQVATKLGMSTSSVRRLEWVRLNPIQDERGVWRFDPAEVMAIPARPARQRRAPAANNDAAATQRRRGKLAARVFHLFARNYSLAQIVVLTKEPPLVVRELYHEWSTSLDEAEWNRAKQ